MTEPHWSESPFYVTRTSDDRSEIRRCRDHVMICVCHPDYAEVFHMALLDALRGRHREGRR